MTPKARRASLLASTALALACTADDTSSAAETDATSGATDPTSTPTAGDDAPGTTGAPLTTDATSADPTAGTTTDPDPSGDSTGTTGTQIAGEPVFVAMGDTGWFATSCDRGHTWTTQAFSDVAGDHTAWTGFGGLAFGEDRFVAGFGWGAEGGHVVTSLDGLEWQDLPAKSFVDQGDAVGYDIYTSAVAFTGDEILVFSSTIWTSSDGITFEATDRSLPPGAEQLRQLRAFAEPGLVVASVESQSGNQHPAGHFVVVSHDGGTSWSEGTGYTPSCSDPIQHWGDIEWSSGVLVVGTRDVCRSADEGATWELVAEPTGEEIRDLFTDADGFVALSGSRVLRSPDGLAWSESADTGMALRAGAWADGSYAVVDTTGTQMLWSDDGVEWQAGVISRGPTSEVQVRDFGVAMLPGGCGG